MTLLLTLVLLPGCAQPRHLQYDFGRAYTQAADMQADLARPSVAESAFELSGEEGIALRQNVEEQTGEEKSGEAEKVNE